MVDRCPVQSQGVKLAPPGGQGGGPRHKKQGLRWQAVLTQVAKECLLVGQTYEKSLQELLSERINVSLTVFVVLRHRGI